MKKKKLLYVYDALCGWCFGFSPTIQKIQQEYKDVLDIEVISGGLKVGESAGQLNVIAPYIKTAYKTVEKTCGVTFGEPFVNGTLHKGTMILNSVPPAIALSIVKERYPDKALEFAALLHTMIYIDGFEPEDYDKYAIYAAKIGYDKEEFLQKMSNPIYKEKAFGDFSRAMELGAMSFPTVLIENNGKYEILFNGYMPYNKVKTVLRTALK
ncbi:MAG TPA: DsbA family protein [Candidatus Kapabacteria bacterium]|nr:DsbA family protein [Ignavibacteria bacterium]HRK58299.1 DsbA family protein [Candidatus Kapabacteria bacterium]